MKIKRIRFPEFERWFHSSQGPAFETRIGFYSVFIGVTAWKSIDSLILLEASVADSYHWSATNIYADKVVHFSKWIDSHNIEAIKQWYNEATQRINKEFSEYIKGTYLESETEVIEEAAYSSLVDTIGPLTVEELKNLQAGDWIWIVDLDTKVGEYFQVCYREKGIVFECKSYALILDFDNFGVGWVAYRNKEEAEGVAVSNYSELPNQAIKAFAEKVREWLDGCQVTFYNGAEERIWDSDEVKKEIDNIAESFLVSNV